jgi:hypothetical protein
VRALRRGVPDVGADAAWSEAIGAIRGGAVSDDALDQAFIDAIRGVVLTFEGEREGRPVVVEYRPAMALSTRQRLGDDPTAPSALMVIGYLADLVVRVAIDGQEVPVGRSGFRLETVMLLANVAEQLAEHAQAWANEERRQNGPYMQRATRDAARTTTRSPGVRRMQRHLLRRRR